MSWTRARIGERIDPVLPQKPASLSVGIQHIAWSIDPTAGGDDVNFLNASESDQALHVVPIVNLHAPMRATRLAILGEAAHQGTNGRLQIQLSLWRGDSPARTDNANRGQWSLRLVAQTASIDVDNPEADTTTVRPLVADFGGRSFLLEPPQVYFIGVQVTEPEAEDLVVRCPQGALATNNLLLAAWRANIAPTAILGEYPNVIRGQSAVQYFFAAALSDMGAQFFLERE